MPAARGSVKVLGKWWVWQNDERWGCGTAERACVARWWGRCPPVVRPAQAGGRRGVFLPTMQAVPLSLIAA